MTRNMNMADGPLIHVRFAGRSFDVPTTQLALALGASDAQIKQALAHHLDVGVARFNDYVVDRHANGNLTVRPEAVFG